MQRNFDLTWATVLVCFCVIGFCVMTLPKVGTTHHTEYAVATASAEKTGQNFVWSTFRADASASVFAPPGDIGLYVLEVEVTGNPPLRTPQLPFSSRPDRSFSDLRSTGKTYRAWGSGSQTRFSAESKADISGAIADDEEEAFDAYP